MSNDYGNWCPEIYRSVYIDRFNDTHVRVAPCCQAKSVLEPVDTFDFATSPYLNKLRTEFDQGQRPDACGRCWKVEDHGHKSRRQGAIEFFKDTTVDRTVQLQSIDHAATWACNLACVMCDPHYSSLWAKEKGLDKTALIEIGRHFQKSNNFLEHLDLKHVKKIHFNGGEPMLNNDQTTLLEELDNQEVLENCFISYNTNGTVMPSRACIDLWRRAGLVKIFFSIDATGPAYEYIRWPAKWAETSENILAMRETLPNNVMFGFNTTIGNYNILEIADVYRWFDENLRTNREGDASDFCWQLAGNFDPSDVSRIIKMQAIEQLEPIAELSGFVAYLRETMDAPENTAWTATLDNIDARRNTSWRQALKTAQFIREVE